VVNGPKTASELHAKVIAELKQPVKIKLMRYALKNLEKRGCWSARGPFTRSLL